MSVQSELLLAWENNCGWTLSDVRCCNNATVSYSFSHYKEAVRMIMFYLNRAIYISQLLLQNWITKETVQNRSGYIASQGYSLMKPPMICRIHNSKVLQVANPIQSESYYEKYPRWKMNKRFPLAQITIQLMVAAFGKANQSDRNNERMI